MQPNRIQRHWPYIVGQLKRRYPLVAAALWEQAHYQYDQIVRLVRTTYAPGRSDITIEAEVRDLLNRWCDAAEQ